MARRHGCCSSWRWCSDLVEVFLQVLGGQGVFDEVLLSVPMFGDFPLAKGRHGEVHHPDKSSGNGTVGTLVRGRLRADYFQGDLSGGNVIVNINHYPPCPNPDKALGQPPHCDRNLLTLLLPGAVNGLEVSYNGDWIKVDPAPGTFIVNFGQQLEVVTNGVLKSIEHRVMLNARLARTSVATFIMPTPDCLISPAEEFVSEENPSSYRTTMFRDFMRIYNVVKLGSSLNLTTNLKKVQEAI
ncbi:hypothetical protein ACQ4PT_025120 [Festuca glaucescens]